MDTNCPLCNGKGIPFYKDLKHLFYECADCQGIFRDKSQLLDPDQEKERYLHHVSNIDDEGYYKFVSPIINEVKTHDHNGNTGLDYGCGHTPVLSELLRKEHYDMEIFDAVFFPETSVLKRQYHFIVCCEVMEHFYQPSKDFKLLYECLAQGGKLICKTHLFETGMDFGQWYYKNDPSHVFIYQFRTIVWVKDHFQFKDVKIEDRLITFSK
jgi:hypothetical protein